METVTPCAQSRISQSFIGDWQSSVSSHQPVAFRSTVPEAVTNHLTVPSNFSRRSQAEAAAIPYALGGIHGGCPSTPSEKFRQTALYSIRFTLIKLYDRRPFAIEVVGREQPIPRPNRFCHIREVRNFFGQTVRIIDSSVVKIAGRIV